MVKVTFIHNYRRGESQSASNLAEAYETSFSRQITLNRMCCSLISEENRSRFRAFPEGYCREFDLSLEQVHAVTDLDVLRLLKLGGTLPNLEKLVSIYGLDMVDSCAEQTGEAPEAIKALFDSFSS